MFAIEPKAWHPPATAGKVVGMCEFQGKVMLAMEGGVFFLNEGGKLEPLEFVQPTPDPGGDAIMGNDLEGLVAGAQGLQHGGAGHDRLRAGRAHREPHRLIRRAGRHG